MAEKGIILGRSSSQVSVYNYPEHLNPFYEDEQHKRLRFWKITKKSNGSRRSSLSLSDIKNWFPTLRKRSSTLGISKTSESPPPIRKSYNNYEEAKYNTFDPAMRHTFNTDLEDYFRRKTLNRSSLQASNRSDLMNESNNFQRNSCSSSFHNYGYQSKESQPITSTPIKKERKKYSTGSLDIINVSSNPFETDDDIVRSATKRRSIKKRRAPLPPILSNNVAEQSEEIKPLENSTEITENTDISKLAEEIEIFVKGTKKDVEVQTTVQSTKKNNFENVTQKMDIETNVEVHTTVECNNEKNNLENSTEKSDVVQSCSNYNPNEQNENTQARNDNDLTDNLELTGNENNQSERKIENVQSYQIQKMDFQVSEQIQSEANETKTKSNNIEKTVNTCDTKTRDFVEENKINDAKKSPEKILFCEQPAKEESSIDSIKCNYSENVKFFESKKSESAIDNINSKKSDENDIKWNNNQLLNNSISNKKSNNTPKIINEKFHVLRIDESEFEPKIDKKENNENELKIDETPNFDANIESEGGANATKYPTKRLSIKEIIESINRSQSLLKFNQVPQSDECCNQQTSEMEKRQSFVNNRKRIFQSEDIINNNNNNINNNKNYDEEQKNTISCKDTTTNLDVEQNSFIYNPIPKPRRKKDS